MEIYGIINIKNNSIYIGTSWDWIVGKKSHLYKLIKTNHPNNSLQNDFNIYGINCFKFFFIEEDGDDYFPEYRKVYWIKKFQKKHKMYNIHKKTFRKQINTY